jgi:hypothetical protein
MTSDLQYSDVEAWLESYQHLLHNIREIPDESVEFNFAVNCDDEEVNVVKPHHQNHLAVHCTHRFSDEFLSNFLNRSDYEKLNFLTGMQAMLMALPGKFLLIDQYGETAGISDPFQEIRFQRSVFPEGPVRQRLIDTIEQFAYARKIVGFNEYIYQSELQTRR